MRVGLNIERTATKAIALRSSSQVSPLKRSTITQIHALVAQTCNSLNVSQWHVPTLAFSSHTLVKMYGNSHILTNRWLSRST